MITGFIYEWVDNATGLKYIGRHEGSLDDGYAGSGTIFLNEYNLRSTDFTRNILWESNNTTVKELKEKEDYFLSVIPDDELYYGSNRRYYNQVKNASGYTSENNPMKIPEVVERMVKTQKRLGLKNPWQNKVDKYGYEEACRLNAKGDKSAGGKSLKGKPKSEEHKKNISLNRKGGKPKGWRKNKSVVE
jgi:hypothetical protein